MSDAAETVEVPGNPATSAAWIDTSGVAGPDNSDFAEPPAWIGVSVPTLVPMQNWFPMRESDKPWDWQILPDGVVYKSYIAGEREPRLATTFAKQNGGDWQWDSTLGGRASILRYGTFGSEHPEGFELQVEGAAFVRLLPESERDVAAVDFRAGIPLAYRDGPWQYKFGYYHISSHLGDEFLLKNPDFDRLNYSRDAFVLGAGYFPTDNLRVYFEVGWAVIYTSGGAEPWEVQTGFEWETQGPTGIYGAPFFALNVHLREEVDWGGNLNILAGWMWRGYHTDHTFRIGLQYFNGKDAQFSFLQESQQLIGWGIRYDF
ncbi:MAG: DUF1207 domain-containing protein [Planctomycetaceae bacterium]|nr:DUF1207 domain-containing protein [Planctomycetaceae bacterium]